MIGFSAEGGLQQRAWGDDPRWAGIKRPYTAEDVVRLRGSVRQEYTLARNGARRLWDALNAAPLVRTFGALTGSQAVQMARAGLERSISAVCR